LEPLNVAQPDMAASVPKPSAPLINSRRVIPVSRGVEGTLGGLLLRFIRGYDWIEPFANGVGNLRFKMAGIASAA
jgi:hypothetical protein